MFTSVVFSILALLTQLNNAQFECRDEFGVYFKCFTEGVGKIISNETAWEQRKKDALLCFTSNGCKEPSLSYEHDLTQLSEEHREKTKKFADCVKGTVAKMVEDIEKCISVDMPGFSFSKLPNEKDLDTSIGHNYAYATMKVHKALQNSNHCAGGDDKKAKKCIEDLALSRREAMNNRLEAICEKRTNCMASFNDKCKQQFGIVRDLMKSCSCEKINLEQYKPHLIDCFDPNLNEDKQKEIGDIIVKVHEKYCERAKSLFRMCEKGDKNIDVTEPISI